MGMRSDYISPGGDEEAEIFGLPGPEWLTVAPDDIRAREEEGHLEAPGYDEYQETSDEEALSDTSLEEQIASLSEEERKLLQNIVRDMLDDGDDES